MRRLLLAFGLLALSSAAFANDDITIPGLNQTDFDGLSQDLGAVTNYKQMQGAASEGITGFDVGLDLGDTQVSHKQAWQDATGSDISNLPFADVAISKGLPFGFDVGGMYSFIPSSNIRLYGLEARYALIDGGIAEPAVGLRATYTHLTGVDDLSFHTTSFGISVSKGFGPVTPYAGIAEVWTNSTPDASTGLTSSNSSNPEFFAGLTFDFGVHLGLEYDHLSGNSSYTLKLGFGF
jgi:predicted porin